MAVADKYDAEGIRPITAVSTMPTSGTVMLDKMIGIASQNTRARHSDGVVGV